MDGLFLISRQHWWERVSNTVIEFQLSITSGSSRARTRIACLVDRNANDCAISPPLYQHELWRIQHNGEKQYSMDMQEMRLYEHRQLHIPLILYRQ